LISSFSASGALMMIDENPARLRTHRNNNISRYRRLLQTQLTLLERDFVEQRLSEEEAALHRLASNTFPLSGCADATSGLDP
jgi:hypothetical protein